MWCAAGDDEGRETTKEEQKVEEEEEEEDGPIRFEKKLQPYPIAPETQTVSLFCILYTCTCTCTCMYIHYVMYTCKYNHCTYVHVHYVMYTCKVYMFIQSYVMYCHSNS